MGMHKLWPILRNLIPLAMRKDITEEEDASKIDGDNDPRDLILWNETPQPVRMK